MRKNNDNRNKRIPYYLWGHHAVLSALRNPKRIIKKLYLTEKNKLYMDQINVLSNHPVKILHLNDIDKLFQQQIVNASRFCFRNSASSKKGSKRNYKFKTSCSFGSSNRSTKYWCNHEVFKSIWFFMFNNNKKK